MTEADGLRKDKKVSLDGLSKRNYFILNDHFTDRNWSNDLLQMIDGRKIALVPYGCMQTLRKMGSLLIGVTIKYTNG